MYELIVIPSSKQYIVENIEKVMQMNIVPMQGMLFSNAIAKNSIFLDDTRHCNYPTNQHSKTLLPGNYLNLIE